MEDKKQLILTIITIFSFITYAVGIYIYVQIFGEWGNIAVDLAIELLGLFIGVLMVVLFGSLILTITYLINRLRITNVFLCWFWILSLYQCAINTFLQVTGRPDEPLNLFFKWLFPNFWYPAKELFFLLISLILTVIWVKKIAHKEFSKIDVGIIALAALILVGGTVISQLFLMN